MTPINAMKGYWKMKDVRKCDIEETIRRIQAKSREAEPGTDEFRRLRADLEQELKNKRLYKETRKFGLSWDTIAMISMVLVISGFAFALDLESPKALKIASYVLKLPGVKLNL